MRGAGIDATELFNEYHPWVNVENMLKTCVVGRLSMTKKFKMPLAPVLQTLSVNGGIVSTSGRISIWLIETIGGKFEDENDHQFG